VDLRWLVGANHLCEWGVVGSGVWVFRVSLVMVWGVPFVCNTPAEPISVVTSSDSGTPFFSMGARWAVVVVIGVVVCWTWWWLVGSLVEGGWVGDGGGVGEWLVRSYFGGVTAGGVVVVGVVRVGESVDEEELQLVAMVPNAADAVICRRFFGDLVVAVCFPWTE
jgi:hypothetical protein